MTTPRQAAVTGRLNAYRTARADLHLAVRLGQYLGLTQQEIAAESGLSRDGVRKILNRKEPGVSYTETYDLSASFAIADLALSVEAEQRLRTALDEHPQATEIEYDIEQAITAKLREHGVDTDTGEWFGEWSASDIVRSVLDRYNA
jgi:transcriptional regulator with XRE-family HTH domain